MPLDYLDARQLEAFVAVMSIGSMTGAAQALRKSQPVVTRLIQDLESELGFPVLHRNGPRIAPTEEGSALFVQAELFLSGLKTISETAYDIANDQAGTVRLAAVPPLAAGIAPLALSDLPDRGFPLDIHLSSMTSENVVQAIVARTAEVGIASLPFDNPGVDVHWIGEVSYVAVIASDDPLAKRHVITASDFRERRLLTSANPYRLRRRIDQALKHHDVEPAGITDSNTSYVSLALARSGLGIGIVESVTLTGLPIEGLTVLPLDFHVPFYWGVITATGVPLSTPAQSLIVAIERRSEALPTFRKHDVMPSLD